MKKLALLGTALLLATSFSASAQLVNSVDISTGYDNVTSSLLANGTQDNDWQITSLAAPFSPVTTMPYGAYVQNPWTWASPVPTTAPGSKWISFNSTSMTTGVVDNAGNGRMTIRYTFEMCSEDDVQITANMRSDNYISQIDVDGSNTGFVQSNTSTNWTSGSTFSYPVTLGPGVHTIDVYIVNSGSSGNNPSGLAVSGTITSTNNSIIDRANYPSYVCSDCDDQCYWTLNGNNITGSNIFGTLSPDDVRIKTNNTYRGVMDQNGQLGWNTMSPTAYLHILCTGNVPDDGGAGSDVRFERLETNRGSILVIDEEGYVYNSRIPIEVVGDVEGKKMQDLETRIAELETKLQQVSNALSIETKNQVLGSRLEQNSPNPMGKETVIKYFIQNMQQNAQIIVTDVNGRKIAEYSINQTGAGQVTFSNDKLATGNYVYTLLVDGNKVDSKKIVVANQ